MLIAGSLALPYLVGIGFLVALGLPELKRLPQLSRQEKAALLTALLCAGILVDYLLVLLLGSVKASLTAGAVLSLAGWGFLAWRQGSRLLNIVRLGWLAWVLVLYLVLLYGIPILFDPLVAGDARSIWFFHGKMIYYTGSLSAETGLSSPSVEFSHVDYPKLSGVLAAQLATVAGYWNEYLPKGSLMVLFMPVLLGAVSFFRGIRLSFCYLVAMLFFGAGWYLWNGYMDGYLALYAAFSLLFWGRWLAAGSTIDLYAGTLLLGIVMNLKNEGALFVLALVAALAVTKLIGGRDVPLRVPVTYAAAALLPLAAFALWSVKKGAWGLQNDLRLGAGSLPIIGRHLDEGAFSVIWHALVNHSLVGKGAIILVAAMVIARLLKVRLSVPVFFPALAGLFYFCGIFCVYLATTADLTWHLSTSATRTMMTVLSALFAATFLVLREMERVDEPVGEARGESGGSS